MGGNLVFFTSSAKRLVNQDRKEYCLVHQDIIDAIHPGQETLARLSGAKSAPSAAKLNLNSSVTPIARIAAENLSRFESQDCRGRNNRRLARLACRLEEYYLMHRGYPERLDELSDLPPHLSQEVSREKPLHYQRKGGGYVLYSPGWDGSDRGGTPRGITTEEGYDWVWPGP